MKEKCTKFEGLFVFSNKEFEEHIKICEDCAQKKAEFDKISNLIKEAKPLYFKQKNKARKALTAAVMFLFLVAGTLFTTMNYYTDIFDTIKYGETLCAEDLGLPVDSYGLIMVD